ncbi:MAG: hypothetical protein ACRC6X_04965 [Culicoidibacterales bacterium]
MFKLNFLWRKSSFIKGASNILGTGGTRINDNNSKSAKELDAVALASDWTMIGSDIDAGINEFKKSEKKESIDHVE